MKRRTGLIASVLPTVIALAAVIAPPAGAGGIPAGVPPGPAVCGTNWTTIQLPSSVFHIYNDDFGGYTCLSTTAGHLGFTITKDTGTSFHAYPNISSGWESGRYTCTGHTTPCYKYPVQVSHDGAPTVSLAGTLHPGTYNMSLDIWTNKTDAHPFYSNGTEIMIWLAHPGLKLHNIRWVWIDHATWGTDVWTVHRAGTSWRLLIYFRAHPVTSATGLRLNDFFHNAEYHGYMRSWYWLTAIDAGFELVSGGVWNNIHYYSLTGLAT
jgi:hypothetical protein